MGTKIGRVPHWHWAEDDPKSEGSPCWRRSTMRDDFFLLRERGKGQPIFLIIRKGWDRRQLACFQAGPAARNREFFAGADLDLGWRKRCPEVTSRRGRSLALGDRLVVSFGTAKRLPSARDSLLSTDAGTSKAFSDGHMLLSIDSYEISTTPRSNNPSLDVSFWGWCWLRSNRKPKAASACPPRRTRRSYPKGVGVGFHLFRGAASSGRETIHSPPSVKGGAETF